MAGYCEVAQNFQTLVLKNHKKVFSNNEKIWTKNTTYAYSTLITKKSTENQFCRKMTRKKENRWENFKKKVWNSKIFDSQIGTKNSKN